MSKEISVPKESTLYWDVVRKGRGDINRLYKSMFKIPVIYDTKTQVIKSFLREMAGKKMLDVGGGARFVSELCRELNKGIEYKSMDKDHSFFHDYYSLDDVHEKFDCIFLLDVIEHLPLNDGISMLAQCRELLSPKGKLVVTIPNNLHPTAYTVDCTHITSYRYNDLGGLIIASGFKDIEVFRISAKKKLKHRIMGFLLKPVLDFLDLDFATLILITAKNRE